MHEVEIQFHNFNIIDLGILAKNTLWPTVQFMQQRSNCGVWRI